MTWLLLSRAKRLLTCKIWRKIIYREQARCFFKILVSLPIIVFFIVLLSTIFGLIYTLGQPIDCWPGHWRKSCDLVLIRMVVKFVQIKRFPGLARIIHLRGGRLPSFLSHRRQNAHIRPVVCVLVTICVRLRLLLF